MPITAPILEPWLEQRSPGEQVHQESPRVSSLGCQASWYRDNLGHCSEAMLQYEWAWMHGRIAALARCRIGAHGNSEGDAVTNSVDHGEGNSPESAAAPCPPPARLQELLSECQLFHTLLLQEFTSRGLRPLPPRGPVVASEEAWEITSASVRQAWGIRP